MRVRPTTGVNEHFFVSRNAKIMVKRAARVNSSMALCRKMALNNANGSANGERPAVKGGILVNTNTGILNPFGMNSGAGVTTNTMILRRVPPSYATIKIPTEIMGRGNIHISYLSRVRVPSPMSRRLYEVSRHVTLLRGRLGGCRGARCRRRGREGCRSRGVWRSIAGGEKTWGRGSKQDRGLYLQSRHLWLCPCQRHTSSLHFQCIPPLP